MDETVETSKTRRGWPKGKARGPRKALVASPTFVAAPEPEAPIHVRLRLKNYPEVIEFGCAEHTVENSFHVFMYPSERDRYRTTRREFAISEIIEIEITAARQATWGPRETELPKRIGDAYAEIYTPPQTSTGPKIHSAHKSGMELLQALETSSGPIKMDTPPGMTFGDSAG
jgi:hypothetical protein